MDDEQIEDGEGITVEEMWAWIDREARARLGMSGEEFAGRYRQGDLPDTLAVNEIGILVRFADDIRVPA